MRSNHFDSMILGTINNGQGFVNAVEGTHRAALRILVCQIRAPPLLAPRQLACAIHKAHAGRRRRRHHGPCGDVSELFGQSPPARPALDAGVVVVDPGTVGVG